MYMIILGQYTIEVNMIKYNDLNNNKTRITTLIQAAQQIKRSDI